MSGYNLDRRLKRLEEDAGDSEFVEAVDFLRCIGILGKVERGVMTEEEGDAAMAEIVRGRKSPPWLTEHMASVASTGEQTS
jgi:hypothetical protein